MTEEQADWVRRRREAADEHVAALDRRKAAETEQARAQVAAFVTAARERGLRPEPLRAKALNGRTTYRTSLVGWYVKRDQTMAVGEDGAFYVLTAPAGVMARFKGAEVAPSDPPLIAGVGGRDGESIPLQTLLDRRLEEG